MFRFLILAKIKFLEDSGFDPFSKSIFLIDLEF